MEIEETVDIFLFDLEEHHDVSGPVHLIFDHLLKELFNHLDVLLCLFIENLSNGLSFLIITNFLYRHRGQPLDSSLINLRSHYTHA